MPLSISLEKKLKTESGLFSLKVDAKLEKGEFAVLYGRSGAGKTTTLRMIAGLTEPDRGYLCVGDTVWYDSEKKISLPVKHREIGFVFQDYALFPNMTVRGNMDYALEDPRDAEFIDQLLEITELSSFADRRPRTLSGGQKQRLALARALVRKPKLVLMDEPLSALDEEMRWKLQDELLKLRSLINFTALMVTHDKEEIFRVADRVIRLENGMIAASGTPSEIFGKK